MDNEAARVAAWDQTKAEMRHCAPCILAPTQVGITSRMCQRHWIALYKLTLIED